MNETHAPTDGEQTPIPQFMSAEDEISAIADMHKFASTAIEEHRSDPRQQSYFVRMDKRKVVRTDIEAHYCIDNEIKLAQVDYQTAMRMVIKEDRDARVKRQSRAVAKRAKAARKRNRKR